MFSSENIALTPLNNLMKASGKVLKKDRVYKIKSKKLTRICNYFLIRWNKFILLKSIEPTTKSINQILLIRHFFDEHKSEIARYETDLAELKTSYSKLPDSKDILDKLDKLQEKRIPLCKSILLPNLLWTSFIKYEITMEFTWVRR